MRIGVIGTGRDQSFFMKIVSAFSGMANVSYIDKAVAPTPFMMPSRANKHRNSGGHLNQRQLRKRAAQGCKTRSECRLKQRKVRA